MIIQNDNGKDARATFAQRAFITGLAWALIIMSVFCNVLFYKEFGFAYGIFGMLLDLSKIAFITAFMIFSGNSQRYLVEITSCIIAWFALTAVSLGAAYGFLAQINEVFEQERLKSSHIYESHQNAVETAQNRVDSLAQYASLDTSLIGTIAALKGKVSTWQAKYNHCKPRHWTNCFNPAQAKIDQFSEQLLAAQSKFDGHQNYQSAVTSKDAAMNKFASLDVSSANAIHPLFSDLGAGIGYSPNAVKSAFIILTAVLAELVGSLLMFFKNRLTPTKSVNMGFTEHDNVIDTLHTVYIRVVNDIKAGTLKSASYNVLRKKYKLNQFDATNIRDQLIDDGLAVSGRSNELTLFT